MPRADGAVGRSAAIVGMACRLPGAVDKDTYWRNLLGGVESLTRFSESELLDAGNDPAEVSAADYVKAAFLLPDADKFDAGFFGYSPREARLTDPQIRAMLEVSWEAFEDAGLVPGRHLGPVGVYAATGSVVTSYLANVLRHHPDAMGHTVSVLHLGNDTDFAGTRVSFKLDLTGPSLNVQTACSTSMVLLDLARRAIENGECDIALATAATIRVPQVSGYSAVKGSVHATDGHIRAFDAEASGTHFSSGVVALLLKDLDKALADGDPIHGVVRGSALNNDGARKANYAGTSVEGQSEAMAGAIARAGIDPASIGYVECHGTGTVVGDPREFEAVKLALGIKAEGGGPTVPRVLGSVKPNIGHAEQSAGLASVVKAVLALKEGVIPPTINFRTPNPRLGLERSGFAVNGGTPVPFPDPTEGLPRRALVNGLGIGGTNGAVVLEQAPPPKREARPKSGGNRGTRAARVFLLSAKSPEALEATVARHRAWLIDHPEADLGDICHTLAVGRESFDYRMALVVSSLGELVDRLDGFTADRHPARSDRILRKIGFLFSGQGSQAPGMGRALHRAEPVFRAALEAAAVALDPHLERPLLEVLFEEAEGPGAAIHQTAFTQPCLFAVEHALASLVQSWGIQPAALVGHSVGEFAAVRMAGTLSLEGAARLIAARGRLMQALPAGGAMAALLANAEEVGALLTQVGRADLTIAAYNGPSATVLSGAGESLEAALALAEDRGIGFRRLTVSHAFHSPLMDPILADLRGLAEREEVAAPILPWISTFTGEVMTTAPEPAYWPEQARGAVRYAQAIRVLADQGVRDFVELGPGKSLLALGMGSVSGEDLAWHASLAPSGDDGRQVLELAAALFRRGYTLDWAAVDRDQGDQRLHLPPYAFKRERLWADDLPISVNPTVTGAAPAFVGESAMLGEKLPLPPPDLRFRPLFGVTRLPWLEDHRIHEVLVLPTTVGLATALAGAREVYGDALVEIADFSHGAAMILPDEGEREGHLALRSEEGAERTKRGDETRFILSSRPIVKGGTTGESGDWRAHMEGILRPMATDGERGRARFDVDATRRRCKVTLRAQRYYAAIRALGFGYGPSFRGIESLWKGVGEALARVRLPDSQTLLVDGMLHPAFLDACLHVYPAVLDELGDFSKPAPAETPTLLPVSLERFHVRPTENRELWVHARRRSKPGAAVAVVDLDLFDRDGTRVGAFQGLTLKALPKSLFQAADGRKGGWLHRVSWVEVPPSAPPSLSSAEKPPDRWLILGGDRTDLGAALAEALGPTTLRVPAAERPLDREGARALLESLPGQGGERLGVVHLMGPDSGTLGSVDWADPALHQRVFGSALALAQAIGDRRDHVQRPPRLWLVTRGAMPAGPSQGICDVLQAGLWGLGRTLSLEAPAAWGGLVDLEAGGGAPDEGDLLARVLRAEDGENQVALRGGKRWAARLVRAEAPPTRPRRSEAGTYLVTGGLGALGVETAEWLARNRTDPTLVLASRRGVEAPNAKEVTMRLEALGAKVVLAKADLSKPGDLSALMADLRAMDPPVRGIYHSAGVLADGMADGMTWEQFRRALAPKLDAAWMLHRESSGLPLDDFVLYSSVLSVIGSAGQTNYTTGNACLDALAAHRRALGLPGQSVNWGPWADAGLADGLGERGEAIWKARGMEYIPPSLGREAFDILFDGTMTQAVVALADWSLFLRQFQNPPPFYAELVEAGSPDEGLSGDGAALRARLAGEDPGDRRAALTAFLGAQAASTLGLGTAPDPDRPLREMGLDSLMSVTLINRVEGATGTRISAATLLRGPSIGQLIDEVWPELLGVEAVAKQVGGTAARTGSEGLPGEVISEGLPGEVESDGAVYGLPTDPPVVRDTRARVGSRAGSWLMPITVPRAPRFRLFCFPFAGGGSAAFRTWADQTDPSIEMYAVEPPGRLARIHEPPVRDMETFVSSVLKEMEGLLDVPYALFGHCLGGLTLYETARRLMGGDYPRPRHLFCSGARPPDRVRVVGAFEKRLSKHLAGLRDYQPLVPAYRQSDAVFASIIRQFDMAASDEFLGDEELRRLMLPAVRAEFEMTTEYLYRPGRPWEIPITCFVSRGDPYVSREDILGWGRFTNSRLAVHMREGTHYSIFEDAAFIQRVIARELFSPPGE
ncbi:MAG: KR domain-containing protein [Rhodospirillum sp.]|nr:KR domain-containing protein [Rhodospirillum sp.]MCF8492091.1 KR domain-containing protein [Rhodospirillum sp.]MCF8501890.1 KR domain-containing protein [Rhodospirillum sp.]